MGIKKQEFYEGAALHMLVRAGNIINARYDAPFFVLNNRLLVYLKYSTQVRSPWGFTFMPEEQSLLASQALQHEIVIGLICGSDGVVGITYDAYRTVANPRRGALRVACYRNHGEHYEVNGPDGRLETKVPPSAWRRILEY